MPKPRNPDSLLTKLENMQVGDQIFVKKSNGFVADNINTIVKRNPGRRYRQQSLYTHEKPEFTSLDDFTKIICIIRLA